MKNIVKNLDGNGRQKCTKCNHKSIAGIVKGKGLCPYHWAHFQWGKKWADSCYPNYK